MSDPVTFIVPGRPHPKERARRGANGHWYTPKETQQFEKTVAQCAMAAGLKLDSKDKVRLRVEMHFGKGLWPDASNVVKSVEDGLMLCCPEWDDRNVVEGYQVSTNAVDEPYTRVTVEVIEGRE